MANIFNKAIDWLVGSEEPPSTINNAPTNNGGIDRLAPAIATPIKGKKITANLPKGRASYPSNEGANNILTNIDKQYKTVNRNYLKEVIPIIRKLMMANPDVSQAMHNVVSLGNTGHKIMFDRKVPQAQVDKMRHHLHNKHADWSSGQAGMDGLVNKMFYQILVGGALSNEWVPNDDLTSIDSVILVNPEEIVFRLDSKGLRYLPYQEPRQGVVQALQRDGNNKLITLVPLNLNTYKYYALNGDTEVPYGFPPYMSVLPKICTQKIMNDNIDFVVNQLGLTGFLEALITKPDQENGESDKDFETRLETLLSTAKTRVEGGFNDGVVVGFNGDHEFKFNSVGKDFDKVMELYKNNELQIASAVKQDAALWGRDYGTSETQITVVFMKMLSELKNLQNIIKTNLEFGYQLELRLAGFNFEYLKVHFNRSTIQDDLKYQQGEEYKIKNVQNKLLLGMINQDQAADELGYETPAFPKPVVPLEVIAGVKSTDPSAGDKAKATKNKDAKTTRSKDKAQ